jgi:hypothetical protein
MLDCGARPFGAQAIICVIPGGRRRYDEGVTRERPTGADIVLPVMQL